jgi:hypothetical protein
MQNITALVMFYNGKNRVTYLVEGAGGVHDAVAEAWNAHEGGEGGKATCTSESTFSNLRDAAGDVLSTLAEGGIDYLDCSTGIADEQGYVEDAGMNDEVIVLGLPAR